MVMDRAHISFTLQALMVPAATQRDSVNGHGPCTHRTNIASLNLVLANLRAEQFSFKWKQRSDKFNVLDVMYICFTDCVATNAAGSLAAICMGCQTGTGVALSLMAARGGLHAHNARQAAPTYAEPRGPHLQN